MWAWLFGVRWSGNEETFIFLHPHARQSPRERLHRLHDVLCSILQHSNLPRPSPQVDCVGWKVCPSRRHLRLVPIKMLRPIDSSINSTYKCVSSCWLISRPRLLASRPHACSSSVLDTCLKCCNTWHTCVILMPPTNRTVLPHSFLSPYKHKRTIGHLTRKRFLASFYQTSTIAFVRRSLHTYLYTQCLADCVYPRLIVSLSRSLREEENYMYIMASIITRR